MTSEPSSKSFQSPDDDKNKISLFSTYSPKKQNNRDNKTLKKLNNEANENINVDLN